MPYSRAFISLNLFLGLMMHQRQWKEVQVAAMSCSEGVKVGKTETPAPQL
jgi:hypothetical protein